VCGWSYLWVGGVRSCEGAEGGAGEGGGVEGGDPHRQVSGAQAEGRTLKLDLLNQPIDCLQGPEGEEPRLMNTEMH